MPRNVEIKARATDLDALAARAEALGGILSGDLHQQDTFFPAPHGRLKLRTIGDGRGELIAYRRADEAGPKASDYSVVPTDCPDALAAAMSAALGTLGVVRKRRRVYLIGRTRVHLDRVEGLGDFVELEVVLRPDQPADEGRAIADDLMRQLGIDPQDLVRGAYLDLQNRAGVR